MSAAAGALGAALALVSLSLAEAQGPGPRVLVVAGDEPALERALAAELEAIGFHASREETAVSIDREGLGALAERRGASAVLALRRTTDGLEVWVVDRLTGKLVLRVLAEADARSTVLRAVEVLRASFLELVHPPASATMDEVDTPAEADAARRLASDGAPATRTPIGGLALGAGVRGALSFDPGGMGFGAHVVVDLSLETPWVLGARVWGVLPTVPLEVRAEGGSASQTLVLAGLSIDATLAPIRELTLRVGLGGGFSWMQSRGVPEPGLSGRDVASLGAVLSVEVESTLWLDERVGLSLGWRGPLSIPRFVLIFDGVEVTQWGQPAQVFELGLRVRLWQDP